MESHCKFSSKFATSLPRRHEQSCSPPSKPLPPDVPVTTDVPVPPPYTVPPMTAPANLPSRADAERIGRELLTKVGASKAATDWTSEVNDGSAYGVATACVPDTACPAPPPPVVTSRSVMLHRLVGGVTVTAMDWYVTVGDNGVIETNYLNHPPMAGPAVLQIKRGRANTAPFELEKVPDGNGFLLEVESFARLLRDGEQHWTGAT